ncbi:MAG: SprB repeat-containing protein, partial [Bacteroidota bacterium]
MKQHLRLIGLFALLFMGTSLLASHIVGDRVSYECVGGNIYRFKLTQYWDCSGSLSAPYVPLGSGNIPPVNGINTVEFNSVGCGGAATPLASWNFISWTDVTLLCPGLINSCQTGNSWNIKGYAELTHTRDYVFTTGSCNEATFSFSNCCRNGGITNLNGNGSSFYNEVKIKLDSSGCSNSSPQFLYDPQIYVCNSDTVVVDLTAFDPDGDSLVYVFEQPLGNGNTPLAFNTGYSLLQPMGPNWDVSLDPNHGGLTVIGNNSSSETAVMAVAVYEYRDGIYLGKSRIDFQVVGIDCANNEAPDPTPIQMISGGQALGPYHIRAYEGVTTYFSMTFSDDPGDSLRLTEDFLSRVPNTAITTSGVNPLQILVQWTPTTTFSGTGFYAGPRVADNGCPIPVTSYVPIEFEVVPFALEAVIVNSDCQLPTGSIDLSVNPVGGPFTYSWSNGATTEDLINIGPGVYRVIVNGPNNFQAERSFIVEAGNIQNAITMTEASCGMADGSISLTPSGGQTPYTYLWSHGPTTSTVNSLAPGGYSVVVKDALGCLKNESLILEEEDSCKIYISGRVYFDDNQNCVQDTNELGTSNILILSDSGFGVLTDSLGDYTLTLDTGVQVITAYTPDTVVSCAMNPDTFYFPFGGVDTSGNDFPWYRVPIQDLEVLPYGMRISPGFPYQQRICVRNKGNFPMFGNVVYYYDSQFEVQNIIPAPITHDTLLHTTTWDLANLQPYRIEMFRVEFVPDSTLPLGGGYSNRTIVLPLVGDVDTTNNIFSYTGTISGSYDPNNKVVQPEGLPNKELGLIKDEDSVHTYAINFQNVGTAPAINVLLRDTLSDLLDITTLEAVASTDDYELSIKPGPVLEFLFRNIYLPDSATDPLGSQGMVIFTIEHKRPLLPGTQIINRAGIFFDFNAPIITNDVINTIYVQPEIALPIDPSAIYCQGQEVTAFVQVEGMPPYSYQWSSGNELLNTLDLSISDSLDQSGWYVVTMTDSFGIVAQDSVALQVRTGPSADVNWTLGVNGEVNFEAIGVEVDSYEWQFGNGETST